VLPDACGIGDNCVDWDDDDNFVSMGGLYDADIQVYEEQDHLEDAVCFLWTVDEMGCTCATTTQRACARLVDAEGGAIEAEPGSWDGTTLTPSTAAKCYPPDRVTIAYRAGQRDPRRYPRYWSYVDGANVRGLRQTDPFGARMAEAIVRLANTLFPDDARCGCTYASQIWARDKMLVGYGSATNTTSDTRPTIEENRGTGHGRRGGCAEGAIREGRREAVTELPAPAEHLDWAGYATAQSGEGRTGGIVGGPRHEAGRFDQFATE